MRCPSCGHEMPGAHGKRALCTNPQCRARRWPATRGEPAAIAEDMNVVELTAAVERDSATPREYVGTIYLKEVRVIEGCRCQGVSLSLVAAGENKDEVRDRTFAAVRSRAELYRNRGYEVRMGKAAA